MSWFNWAEDQPSFADSQDAVELRFDGFWSTTRKSDRRGFICVRIESHVDSLTKDNFGIGIANIFRNFNDETQSKHNYGLGILNIFRSLPVHGESKNNFGLGILNIFRNLPEDEESRHNFGLGIANIFSKSMESDEEAKFFPLLGLGLVNIFPRSLHSDLMTELEPFIEDVDEEGHNHIIRKT